MPELMRFQVARAVQRRRGVLPVIRVGTSEPVLSWLAGAEARELATAFLAERGLGPPTRQYVATSGEAATLEQIRLLAQFLADRDNDPDPAELETFLQERLDGEPSAIAERWNFSASAKRPFFSASAPRLVSASAFPGSSSRTRR